MVHLDYKMPIKIIVKFSFSVAPNSRSPPDFSPDTSDLCLKDEGPSDSWSCPGKNSIEKRKGGSHKENSCEDVFWPGFLCQSQPVEKHPQVVRQGFFLARRGGSSLRRKKPCEQPMKGRKKWREGAVDGVVWGTLGRDRQSEWFPRRH